MLAHALVAVSSLLIGGLGDPPAVARTAAAVVASPATTPDDQAPQPTINEFIPEDRSLGDCISALPKPGCGSEARGGWRQSLVLAAILAGLAFIAWRVVRSARRARARSGSVEQTAAP